MSKLAFKPDLILPEFILDPARVCAEPEKLLEVRSGGVANVLSRWMTAEFYQIWLRESEADDFEVRDVRTGSLIATASRSRGSYIENNCPHFHIVFLD